MLVSGFISTGKQNVLDAALGVVAATVECGRVCAGRRWEVFFFKQKTAYEMLEGDWSSDVLFRSSHGLVALLVAVPLLQMAACLPRPFIGRASGRERV